MPQSESEIRRGNKLRHSDSGRGREKEKIRTKHYKSENKRGGRMRGSDKGSWGGKRSVIDLNSGGVG